MRRRRPFSVSAPSASYTAWTEIKPISPRTASATTSAVTCGSSETARRTANRCGVIRRPRWRSSSLGSATTSWTVSKIGTSRFWRVRLPPLAGREYRAYGRQIIRGAKIALAVALLAGCCTSSASALSGPASPAVKQHLRAGLRAIEADSAGVPLSGGPIIWPISRVENIRKTGVLYDVDVMPTKGFLYLAERDRRGRLHTLFVDVHGDVSMK